MIGIF